MLTFCIGLINHFRCSLIRTIHRQQQWQLQQIHYCTCTGTDECNKMTDLFSVYRKLQYRSLINMWEMTALDIALGLMTLPSNQSEAAHIIVGRKLRV